MNKQTKKYVQSHRVPLTQALTKYLHLDDPWVVDVALATIVANLRGKEPLWLLLVNPPSTGKTELVQMFKEVDANFIAKVLMTHSTGLQICCLSPWVDDDGHHISAEILKTLLRELATQAHAIILDFPLERSNSTALFLQLSQLLNVVMDVDPMNIAAAKMQLKFVHRQSHAPVFLTGVNRINIPPTESLRQIQDEMECATFTMIPSASELCYTANIQHLPLVCIKPSSTPGLQFVKLRDQILSHLNGDDTEDSRDRRGKSRRKKDRRHSSDGW
jgi:Flp pilus assembly CpaE family ATPase